MDILILGGGTGGTIAANRLRSSLGKEHSITLVDSSRRHNYQPGFTFVPFGIYSPEHCRKPQENFIPRGVEFFRGWVEKILPEERKVVVDGRELKYDYLVVALGSKPSFSEVKRLEKVLYRKAFDFYTYRGAQKLKSALKSFKKGKLLIAVAELPIKCPAAPLSFAFLAQEYLERKGVKDFEVELSVPSPEAFTKKEVSETLEALAESRGISIVTDFHPERVEENKIVDHKGDTLDYDLLVAVPPHLGSEAVIKSGIGDALGFIPTHRHTLKALEFDRVYVVGDASNLPTSKAASSAHFQAEVAAENISREIYGIESLKEYNGRAICYVITGFNEAIMLELDYSGLVKKAKFPLPLLGPLTPGKVSRASYLAKLMSRWFYWHSWLKGKNFPLPEEGLQ